MSCVPLGKPLPSLALSLYMSPPDPRLWSSYLQDDFPPLGLVACGTGSCSASRVGQDAGDLGVV